MAAVSDCFERWIRNRYFDREVGLRGLDLRGVNSNSALVAEMIDRGGRNFDTERCLRSTGCVQSCGCRVSAVAGFDNDWLSVEVSAICEGQSGAIETGSSGSTDYGPGRVVDSGVPISNVEGPECLAWRDGGLLLGIDSPVRGRCVG